MPFCHQLVLPLFRRKEDACIRHLNTDPEKNTLRNVKHTNPCDQCSCPCKPARRREKNNKTNAHVCVLTRPSRATEQGCGLSCICTKLATGDCTKASLQQRQWERERVRNKREGMLAKSTTHGRHASASSKPLLRRANTAARTV